MRLREISAVHTYRHWCFQMKSFHVCQAVWCRSGAFKDGFGEAVFACDMPESRSFRLLTVARRGSCGPKRRVILLGIQSLVFVLARKRCGEVYLGTWFRKPGSFFQSQQAGSMFHSHRGGWRWQETSRAWTCLQNWWYCTARSCLVWPLSAPHTHARPLVKRRLTSWEARNLC